MTASTTVTALDLPGFRISLCSWLNSSGVRVGSVTLSQRASKAMGHHCEPGFDGGESARSLTKQLNREISDAAQRLGVVQVEIYANKRNASTWMCDVLTFHADEQAAA